MAGAGGALRGRLAAAGALSGFSREWLALRAPFDTQARSEELARRFIAAWTLRPRVADLGAGTGANIRYLARLAPPGVIWRLFDSDAALLAEAARNTASLGSLEILHGDLARDLSRTLDGLNALSASAMMDLVSARWFDGLAAAAVKRRLPLLFALSIDGRLAFFPDDEIDGVVAAAFARDQHRDKGFGAALGPDAPRYMAERLGDLGARVTLVPTDWRIPANAPLMLSAMVEGIANAASQASAEDAAAFAAWAKRRHEAIGRNALTLVVGHQDLLAIWP